MCVCVCARACEGVGGGEGGFRTDWMLSLYHFYDL